MGEAFFYHMTSAPLERTLPVLLTRATERGWRVLVRGRDPERLDWLDQELWLGPPDSFLPHGRAGGDFDADQPILLTSDSAPKPGFACLMTLDGAEVLPAEISESERTCILFDGNDMAAVETARGQWRSLTAAGINAKYWSDASGKWEQKA